MRQSAKPTAIVLAAGRSSRMGEEHKLLLPWGEKRIVQVVVETLLEAPLKDIVVVTGHQRGEVERLLRDYPLQLMHNPRFGEGMSTSIGTGVEAAGAETGGYLFALGDMPRVGRETIAALCAAFSENTDSIIVPAANGQRGNPVVFSSSLRDGLLRLEGDRGAKVLLQRHADRVVEVAVEDRGIFVDVDTPEAYREAVGDAERGR